jgi:hypothetical protein
MAKVTLIIEDVEAPEGQLSVTIAGDFNQPGKSYDEMTQNPTPAVSIGLGVIASLANDSSSFKGHMLDEFGTTKDFEKLAESEAV